MASTIALRRRIKTAQNVSKTTRAMQMIAASKLKKAQLAALSSRPYVEKLSILSQNITAKTKNIEIESLHPYLKHQKVSGKTLFIVISPDKGLCGGMVTNVIREYLKYKNSDSLFITIGKKIEGVISSTTKNLLASFPFGNTLPSFEIIAPIIKIIDENFLEGKVDSVKIITTHFTSVFLQTTKITNLLPVMMDTNESKNSSSVTLFEPTTDKILPVLLKRYIEMVLFQNILESYASEQASRMIAMQNATNNAKDIVNDLTLLYNKARQEKITNEILDISSAAFSSSNE